MYMKPNNCHIKELSALIQMYMYTYQYIISTIRLMLIM